MGFLVGDHFVPFVGLIEGWEGVEDGFFVRLYVGIFVGLLVGRQVGFIVGVVVEGVEDGLFVRLYVGIFVGLLVGCQVGFIVGREIGESVGKSVVFFVGENVDS